MADSGVSQNKVGVLFGFPGTTIKRHLREHRASPPTNPITLGELPGLDPTSVDPSTLGEAGRRIHALALQADALLKRAATEKMAPREITSCLNAAKGALELLGKLTGELDPRMERKLLESVEWRSLVKSLLEVLRPFPDARAAVIAFFSGTPIVSTPAPLPEVPAPAVEPEAVVLDEDAT